LNTLAMMALMVRGRARLIVDSLVSQRLFPDRKSKRNQEMVLALLQTLQLLHDRKLVREEELIE
jgi:hypothetical protein